MAAWLGTQEQVLPDTEEQASPVGTQGQVSRTDMPAGRQPSSAGKPFSEWLSLVDRLSFEWSLPADRPSGRSLQVGNVSLEQMRLPGDPGYISPGHSHL
jgi:hypothetical protein